jgi:hypothetical protein
MRDAAAPARSDEDEWWGAVLSTRAAGRPPVPISSRRLDEVPRKVLRVECLRCFRVVRSSSRTPKALFQQRDTPAYP